MGPEAEFGLEDYLRQQQAVGSKESSGRFTLDLLRQAQKYARFLEAEPALYLLRGVQLAVLMGAPEVRIRLGRSRVELVCECRGPYWGGLRQALEDEEPDQLGRLVRAMLLAATATGAQVELRWAHSTWSLQEGLREHESWKDEVHLTVTPKPQPWYRRLLPGHSAHLLRSLEERCLLCPIPVLVDARRCNRLRPEGLRGLLEPTPVAAGETCVRYSWLAETMVPEAGGFCLEAPLMRQSWLTLVGGRSFRTPPNYRMTAFPTTFRWLDGAPDLVEYKLGPEDKFTVIGIPTLLGWTEGYVEGVTRAKEYWSWRNSDVLQPAMAGNRTEVYERDDETYQLNVDYPALRVSRWFGLRPVPRPTSTLLYVQHGLLLDPLEFDSPQQPGGVGIFLGNDLPTDLSGLKPVRNEKVETDLGWVREQWERVLPQIRGSLLVVSEGERTHMPLGVREAWRKLLRNRQQ